MAQRDNPFDMPALLRIGAWGGGAVAALLIAVIAARSDVGAQRLAMAYGSTQIAQVNSQTLAGRNAETAAETRRLAETMRSLSSDRDRLLARVTVLERNLEDVTGSISRGAEPRPEANPSSSPLPSSSSITALTGPTIISTITAAPPQLPRRGVALPAARIAVPHAEPAPDVATTESIATTTEFGVDIGGGATIEALRDLWAAAKSSHGAPLQGLRPVIAVRDGKTGSVDLRLVAGPLANAGAAAKICAALAAGGWSCRPAMFDGQKLAVR